MPPAPQDTIFLEGIRTRCVIGIYDWERRIRQKILIDLELPTDAAAAARRDSIEDALDYKAVIKKSVAFVSRSKFYLVETLADRLARFILEEFNLPHVRLRLSKPGALRDCRNVGVVITRSVRRRR
jgi:dihydroneopterin aldolase